MFQGRSVQGRPRAGTVIGNHAAQRCPRTRRHIGTEGQSVRREKRIQLVQYDARLRAYRARLAIEAGDATVIAGIIQDERIAQSATRQTAARAARDHRNIRGGTGRHQRRRLFHAAGKGNPPRRHLVDGRIRGIQLPRQVIQEDGAGTILLNVFQCHHDKFREWLYTEKAHFAMTGTKQSTGGCPATQQGNNKRGVFCAPRKLWQMRLLRFAPKKRIL